jgi:phosphoribosylanthranilate isomerase
MPSNGMVDVKICGINDPRALDAALDAGADFIGLVVFPPSPRAVSTEQGARLAAHARGSARIVALVVDAEDALLADVAGDIAPDLLQLHGKERPERVSEIKRRFGVPVMKAIPVAEAADLAAVSIYAPICERLLFDARPPKDATRPGGHGRAFDWRLIAGVERSKPIMLSGGLNPENVAAAIGIVRPDAVDVSYGVERAPGEKDPDKIRAFVAAARTAAAALQEKVP